MSCMSGLGDDPREGIQIHIYLDGPVEAKFFGDVALFSTAPALGSSSGFSSLSYISKFHTQGWSFRALIVALRQRMQARDAS